MRLEIYFSHHHFASSQNRLPWQKFECESICFISWVSKGRFGLISKVVGIIAVSWRGKCITRTLLFDHVIHIWHQIAHCSSLVFLVLAGLILAYFLRCKLFSWSDTDAIHLNICPNKLPFITYSSCNNKRELFVSNKHNYVDGIMH